MPAEGKSVVQVHDKFPGYLGSVILVQSGGTVLKSANVFDMIQPEGIFSFNAAAAAVLALILSLRN